MASAGAGIQATVSASAADDFTKLKTKRAYKWVILKLNAETFEVVTDKTGAVKPASDAEFLNALPISEARFAVYDHEVTARSGMKKGELLFFIWTPASAPAHSKMLYSSQRRSGAINAAFSGVRDITATSADEVRRALGMACADDADDGEFDPDA